MSNTSNPIGSARLMKAWFTSGDVREPVANNSVSDGSEDSQFKSFMEAVNGANLYLEEGETDVSVKFLFETTYEDGSVRRTNANFDFNNNILDPHEILGTAMNGNPAIAAWASMMKARFKSEPAHGGQYIYLTVINKEGAVVGRVTARLDECEFSDDHLVISMAFCRRNDAFSKGVGRGMVNERMSNGQFLLVKKERYLGSNFEMLKCLLNDLMTYGKSDMICENTDINFPKWLLPQPHANLPDEVIQILKKVAYSSVSGIEVGLARDYLGVTGRFKNTFVRHTKKDARKA